MQPVLRHRDDQVGIDRLQSLTLFAEQQVAKCGSERFGTSILAADTGRAQLVVVRADSDDFFVPLPLWTTDDTAGCCVGRVRSDGAATATTGVACVFKERADAVVAQADGTATELRCVSWLVMLTA